MFFSYIFFYFYVIPTFYHVYCFVIFVTKNNVKNEGKKKKIVFEHNLLKTYEIWIYYFSEVLLFIIFFPIGKITAGVLKRKQELCFRFVHIFVHSSYM